MTALSLYLQIVDLSTNTVLASTSNILDWSFSSELDKVGSFSVVIPAGDPGDAATSGDYAFAQALLRAGSNLTTGDPPLPLLLELSLDGSTNVDSRRLARQPQRTLTAARRTISEQGGDLGEASLGLAIIERATYNQVPLAYALDSFDGTIVSDSGWGIRHVGDAIPHLAGLLETNPALSSWPSGAQDRLQFVGNVNPDYSTLDTSINIDSATVLATLSTLVNRFAGDLDDPSIGHWVADVSDPNLNLALSTTWAAGSTATNTITIGNAGSTPSPYLTFDATATDDVDETTTAVVHTEQTTVQSDDTGLYRAANFIGGKSLVGVPDDAHINGLAVIRATIEEMSLHRDEWTDALLIVGMAWNNDLSGAITFYHGDGIYRPIPGSPARACLSLAYDNASDAGGARFPGLLMGTPYGVYYSTDAVTGDYTQPTTWVKLAGLEDPVLRLAVEHDPGNPEFPVIFAHAKGTKETTDAIWRWAKEGGQWNWHSVHTNAAIVDFTTSDYQTFWVALDGRDSASKLYQWHIDGTTGWVQQQHTYTLPHGGTIRHVQRVVQTGPDLDTIWVLLDGDQTPFNPSTPTYPSPAYYLVNEGGTWGPSFTNANRDGSLHGPEPEKPVVSAHRVTGGGVTVDPTAISGSGIKVNAFLATSTGALWTDTTLDAGTGLDWRRVSLGGLDDYALENFALGQAQVLLGRTVNRMYTVADNDLLSSNSSGRWWLQTKGRERTLVGIYLSQVTWSIDDAQGAGTGHTLPHNRIRTWGTTNADGTTMTSSPIGAASNTHVYVPHTTVVEGQPSFIPRGLYWERKLDGHGDWTYQCVSQKCHIPGTQISSLPELASNAAVSGLSASKGVAIVARRFMLQHGQPILHISVESSFSTQGAALRTLRATHKVSLKGDIVITDISSAGAAVSSEVFHFTGSETLYVLSHQLKKGAGATVMTTTVLSNLLLETPVTPEQMASGLADSLHNTKVFK